jgi:hypothetical protein
MKKLIAIAALATAAIASPALAGSLTGEVRLGDVRGGKADSTEYRVEAWDKFYGVNVGAELQARQGENSGPLRGAISMKAGVNGPAIAGVQSLVYAELGHALNQKVTNIVAGRPVTTGGNHEFWGAGVKFNRDLVGPVALTAGYRHREGFDGADQMNEERLHGGLSLAVSSNTALGATYYRTRGTTNSDTVGVSVTRKF